MNLKPEEIKAFIEKPFAFIERLGLKALILEPRHVKLMMPLAGNGNHIGSMYAGALFTLAEIPVGAIYLTTFDVNRFYPVIKKMTIEYSKLAKTDITVEMEMSVEKAQQIIDEAEAEGKSEFVLENELIDGGGEVVATSQGLFQIRAMDR